MVGHYDIMLTESKTNGLTNITTEKFLNGSSSILRSIGTKQHGAFVKGL